MKTIFIGQYCIKLERTDSTNSYLTQLSSKKKLHEGTVVIAQRQERGRGQRGAIWESEGGKNLTLSILLYPVLRPDEQFILNKVVSLGVLDFIRLSVSPLLRFSLSGKKDRARIKWPNDIYIGSKKIAGILIENSVSGNKLQQSVIGLGINVNQEIFSAKLPNPTSLKLITAKDFDLEYCLEELCSCIESRYMLFKANLFEKINEDYLLNLYRFRQWANYKYKGERLKAKITGVTKTGKLVLQKENGKILECDFNTGGIC